jgi:hypothetical protein
MNDRPGAPLRSTYVKLPPRVLCEDCPWPGADGDKPGEELSPEHAAVREQAMQHAALAHHRVLIHLRQSVTVEPMHPGTRRKALEKDAEKG